MVTLREELDKLESIEVDIAARLHLWAGRDEGPPTCPPLTDEELAVEEEELGLTPLTFETWEEMLEAVRVRDGEFIRRAEERCRAKLGGK